MIVNNNRYVSRCNKVLQHFYSRTAISTVLFLLNTVFVVAYAIANELLILLIYVIIYLLTSINFTRERNILINKLREAPNRARCKDFVEIKPLVLEQWLSNNTNGDKDVLKYLHKIYKKERNTFNSEYPGDWIIYFKKHLDYYYLYHEWQAVVEEYKSMGFRVYVLTKEVDS